MVAKKIKVLESFHADDGTFIQPGIFVGGLRTNNYYGEEIRLYTREGAEQVIRLTFSDLERGEIKRLE